MPVTSQDPSTDRPAPGPLRGTPVVPGLVYGPVRRVVDDLSAGELEPFADTGAAVAAFDAAAAAVAEGFSAKAARASGVTAEVLTASAVLTRDPGLREDVVARLEGHADLLGAIRGAVAHFVEVFTAMGGVMGERATDLVDIERRLLARVTGLPEPGIGPGEHPSVLVATDLAPADTADLVPGSVLALVTERGGATSHTAIIARQLGIPCLVGVVGALGIDDGVPVLVDGGAGTLEVGVEESEARAAVAAHRAEQALVDAWTGPARTTDGAGVRLLANVADGDSARAAADAPVQGIGLFRTEMCFLGRREEPSVDDQAAVYAEVLQTCAGTERYVVARTLDAGSDKPIAFATRANEQNPALGVRGLRLAADDPGLLERQLDALARAALDTGTETWVMAPMIATVAEAADFARRVHDRGLKAGVMVEVPSAALLADRFLEVVDFLSIGTNDLTQYTMAADRLSPDLAHLTDPWQPAVLQLIAATAQAGTRAGKSVGVCGEAAADPLLAVALIGMGVTSLSMAAVAVRAVGARLSSVDLATCRAAASAALAAADPDAGRDAVRAVLAQGTKSAATPAADC